MPIEYRIDKKRKIVLTVARDSLSDEELLEHKNILMADPEFEKGMVELSDVRAVTHFNLSTAAIDDLVSADRQKHPKLEGYRLAIVVPDDLGFGLARMYGVRTELNVPVGIFRDMNEAMAWLGIKYSPDE